MTAVEPVRRGVRARLGNWLSIVVTVVVALALVWLGYSCIHHDDRSSYSAPAQRFIAGGVTYLANGMLYVVAEPDGGLLAIDEQDRVQANRLNGCVVRWRPDLDGGLFQEDPRCGGATFGRDGAPLNGGLALLRHPLRVAGKNVVVDIRHCTAPEDTRVRPCKDFRQ
jgi:hypothetical protein